MKTKKTLLIGWDAADWKVIHPLLDCGKMPNLQKLIKNGVMGSLSSLRPELSPMLWTSIATGKRPYKHGILGFIEPGPDGKGMRPVSNLSRKTKTIWNILNQNNYRSLVVGWWPSHPAEPINGAMVSNHYQRANAPYNKSWPVQSGTIHPPRLLNNLTKLRVHPQELDSRLIQVFVPDLSTIDQENDRRIESIAKIIADTETVKRATTALMHHEEWDFTAVYFDAIDHFCHGFMEYYPPRLSWVKEDDYQLYKQVVTSGYIYHDILLGSMLDEIDKETTVILVSDHGFHSDHLRPARIPGEPAGPAAQHSPYGVVVISGPDTKKDELLYGSSLLDICPTVLSLFDLPMGDDMDGKVLVNAFTDSPDVQNIPSWDDVPGEDGSHPPGLYSDPMESSEAITRLVELGYIEEPDPDQEKAAKTATRELKYNLAKSYIDAGLHGEAVTVLTKLTEQWPDEFRFGIELSHCYQAIGQAAKSLPLLIDVFARQKRKTETAEEELRYFRKQIEKSDNREEKQQELQPKIRRLLKGASQNPYGTAYLLGVAYRATGDCTTALEYFEQAENCNFASVSASLFIQKGSVYEELKKRAKAERMYQHALSIDGENIEAMLGLCRLLLLKRRNKDAADQALDIVALRYHTPLAHFYLGCALHRLGKLHDAICALEHAVQQNPNFPDAYHRLAYIYKKRLGMVGRAAKYKQIAKEAVHRIRELKKGVLPLASERSNSLVDVLPVQLSHLRNTPPEAMDWNNLKKTIIIVSGLPRSGTSMIMQMLDTGGLSILTDKKRSKDINNPKGYFEHEEIKGLARENNWLLNHGGKVVKIIAQLLPFLPETEEIQYRIIFMERNIDEILLSQQKMLVSEGNKNKNTSDKLLKNGFSRQVEKVKALVAARRIPILYIQHQNCIHNPTVESKKINVFLGGHLDDVSMACVIDKSLYRNRKEDYMQS
jgi:predicted AlkP superfamily phosphohydrolase/phosphomutase/tetratricopeptide (TPR) repeat protein